MDPVLMMLAALALGGAAAAILLVRPFALRAWAAPLLVIGAHRWAHPPDPPGPWDELGLAYLALFAAAWSTPFLFRAAVEAARWINRRTTGDGEPTRPLSARSRRWLRVLDGMLLAVLAGLLASGFWPEPA